MPQRAIIKDILTIAIALVWLTNGLFCKLLNLVPRHQQIVARILGEEYAGLFTKMIGVAEIVMCIWILSRIKSRLCAVIQMPVIATMNIIEFVLTPDLLLFGRMNLLFASVLIVVIFINEFVLKTADKKCSKKMFSLKNHPFAVETFFESSLVVTYAVPKNELKGLLPECLEPDTFNDKWGFVAAAIVDTRNLRPKGFAEFMGNDFILIGFRVFVRYTTNEGKRLRGLYILKSETNKRKMSFWGNIFTHYNYTTTDINLSKKNDRVIISSLKSDLDIEVIINKTDAALPSGSPFSDWKEARRFAGPLPFTFTYNKKKKEVLIIEGVREKWTPKAVEVVKSDVGFINQKSFKGIVLANAFLIEQVPYYWKKGKIEIWKE